MAMVQLAIPELPERVSVEMQFISKEKASILNLKNFTTLSSLVQASSDSSVHGNRNEYVQLRQELAKMGKFPQPAPEQAQKTACVAVMTDSNPTRDRSLQTENKTESSIGVQCDLEKELADLEFEKICDDSAPSKSPQDDLTDIKERFINFTNSNIKSYSNGKIECLQCGEIKAKLKDMESHMALHWGPSVLCFRCGVQFEHKILWKHHKCTGKEIPRLHRLKCPHFHCAAVAISETELFDHLNEHCGTLEYLCGSCSKAFATAGELRCHMKLRKKCRLAKKNMPERSTYNLPIGSTKYRKRFFIAKTLKGKRLVAKTFLSQIALKHSSSNPQLCYVCLKQCKNSHEFHRHMKLCLKRHKQRLQQEKWGNTPIPEARTNGIY